MCNVLHFIFGDDGQFRDIILADFDEHEHVAVGVAGDVGHLADDRRHGLAICEEREDLEYHWRRHEMGMPASDARHSV